MKNIGKAIILWTLGGCIYMVIELLWRGYSHWTMFILGGICFEFLDYINIYLKWETPLWKQMLIGGMGITILEFITGCIVNLWLGMDVWDYSNLPFNILGQICLPFTFIWILLAGVGIVLSDYLRYWLFDEEKPHYVLI